MKRGRCAAFTLVELLIVIAVIGFSRFLAAAGGIHETMVYTAFLGLTGLVLTVNLQAVGGLMIFSLITNPAVAAFQVSRGFRAICLTSSLLGAASALAGFLAAYWLNLPTGACIVLASALILAVCLLGARGARGQS